MSDPANFALAVVEKIREKIKPHAAYQVESDGEPSAGNVAWHELAGVADANRAPMNRLRGPMAQDGDNLFILNIVDTKTGAVLPVSMGAIHRAAMSEFPLAESAIRLGGASGPIIKVGTGSPEGVVTAPVGSVYRRTDGSAGTISYEKQTGAGNTGWVALGSGDWDWAYINKALLPQSDSGGSAALGIGLNGYVATGSVAGNIAFDANATGAWMLMQTAATTDTEAGWSLTAATPDSFMTSWLPRFRWRVQTGAQVTSGRWWVGLFNTTPMASSDPATHGYGFRYDTGADGTAFWRTWTNDGSGGGTATTTSVAFTSNTAYTLEIRVITTASIEFWIDGTLVATHTTNLPSSGQDLEPWCYVRTLNTTAKSIRWASFYVRHI